MKLSKLFGFVDTRQDSSEEYKNVIYTLEYDATRPVGSHRTPISDAETGSTHRLKRNRDLTPRSNFGPEVLLHTGQSSGCLLMADNFPTTQIATVQAHGNVYFT
jgi:hypothetical protein